MEKVTFNIPSMWADHHTLAVREALDRVDGVQEVLASAMYKDVLIKYSSETVTPGDLKAVLAEAGYKIETCGQHHGHSIAARQAERLKSAFVALHPVLQFGIGDLLVGFIDENGDIIGIALCTQEEAVYESQSLICLRQRFHELLPKL